MNAFDALVGSMQLCMLIGAATSPYEFVEGLPPSSEESIPYIEFATPSENRPRNSILVERCKILDSKELELNSSLNLTGDLAKAGAASKELTILTGSGLDPEPFQAMHRCFYIYSD